MATKYSRGRAFEYRVKAYYEKHGWFVIRSAGSKGVADLVAIAPEGKYIHFVQCKLHGSISPDERQKLFSIAEKYGAYPILASANKQGKGVLLKTVRATGEIGSEIDIEQVPREY